MKFKAQTDMSKFLSKPATDVDGVAGNSNNRERKTSTFWSKLKSPKQFCKRNRSEEDGNSSSENSYIIPDDEDEEPDTGWRSWFTLRNTAFSFSILDLVNKFQNILVICHS